MNGITHMVIGLPGSGKTTYCSHIYEHYISKGWSILIGNLDPAVENVLFPVINDIRDLITLEDVVDNLNIGPNGAILYCMEYLIDNIEDWISSKLYSK